MLTFCIKNRLRSLPFSLLFVWITAMFMGCSKDTMQMRKKGSVMRELPPPPSTASSRVASESSQQNTIILLHGLSGFNTDMEDIAAGLSGDNVRILLPTFREGLINSGMPSIANQAEDLFKYIQKEVPDPTTAPLIILGYSQGGLLACILANRYKDQCNIHGIAALGAPLGGVPALQRSIAHVKEFLDKLDKKDKNRGLSWILDRNSLSLEEVKSHMNTMVNTISMARILGGAGTLDLLPGSACLQEVSNFLRHGSHNIPCLLVAGHHNNFREKFPIEYQEGMDIEEYLGDMTQLDRAYAEFITGDINGPHDNFMPLGSQLCRTSSFDNLQAVNATSDPHMVEMPNQPHIKGYVYKNTIHAGNLTVLHGNLYAHEGIKRITTSKPIQEDLKRFIEECTQKPCASQPKSLTAQIEDLALD